MLLLQMRLSSKHISLIFLAFVATGFSFGQVEIDHSINLTGSIEADRTVKGLSDPTELTNLSDASSIIENQFNYGSATAGGPDSIDIYVSPTPTNYEVGFTVYFKSPITNDNGVSININGLGYKALAKGVSGLLDSSDVETGQIIWAVYDGTSFQMMNETSRSCPSGFIGVNRDYCIEINERSQAYFFDAAIACGDIGARMCSWGEWYYAAQKTGLGLTNVTNNWEWVNSSTNNPGQVKTVGFGGITAGSIHNAASNTRSFRCCFTK